ncbi:SDR family oxidoreductase [Microvirga sp. BT688]|nr:SDR family oxidoreductase [Microvirga sp.]
MCVRQERLSRAEQLLAQRALSIVPLVNPALLQDRHDEVNKILQRLRRHHAADVEAVHAGLFDPGLKLISDLLGGANQRRVAGAETLVEDLAQGPNLRGVAGEGLEHRRHRIRLLVLKRLIKILFREVDAYRAREVRQRAFFTSHPPFDHIVVSAAQTPYGPVRTLSLEDARQAMESKFWGAYRIARAARIADRGSLTFISGYLAERPSETSVLQGAINAALEGLRRGLALELSPLRVNMGCSGKRVCRLG